MAGIEKQLEEMRKQLALVAAAMGAASPKQEEEAKRVINSNEVRVAKEKRKEAEGNKIKKLKKKAEERKKKEWEALKEAEILAAQAQGVKDWQRKLVEACEAEIAILTKVNRVNPWP